MAVRTAYDPTAGEVLTAANLERLPGGWIGYAQVTADQTTITTEVDLTGLTVTVTVGPSRRLLIMADLFFTSTVATDHVAAFIKEGSTYLTQRQLSITRANSGEPLPLSVIVAPSSGSHTYKLAGQRAAGSGNVSSLAGATYPAHILVWDIGPAS